METLTVVPVIYDTMGAVAGSQPRPCGGLWGAGRADLSCRIGLGHCSPPASSNAGGWPVS
ncbi:hypothetical protein MCAG_05227 [Micromonospora sp. ATCC 39149]|nr:hypothetical protein MCAG_05227 [Micromonospora sp. ATCC 39149]